MRKLIAAAAAACAAFVVFADAGDVLLSFSSVGPDKYADNSTVLDNECYALVWVPEGKVFAGFAADGSLVDESTGKVVLVAPIASGGRCPETLFEIDSSYAESNFKGGEWGLYLLDTRVTAEDGAVALAGTAAGRAKAVNSVAKVSSAVSEVKEGSSVKIASTAGSVASEKTAVPEGTPRPVVESINVSDGLVMISVTNTVPYLRYNLTGDGAINPVNGVAGGRIMLIKRQKQGVELLRVKRD